MMQMSAERLQSNMPQYPVPVFSLVQIRPQPQGPLNDDSFPVWGTLCRDACCTEATATPEELDLVRGNAAATLVTAIFVQAKIDILLYASSQREFVKSVSRDKEAELRANAQSAVEFLESRRRFAFYARYLLGTDDRDTIELYRAMMLRQIKREIDEGRDSTTRVNIRGALSGMSD